MFIISLEFCSRIADHSGIGHEHEHGHRYRDMGMVIDSNMDRENNKVKDRK
jgi:hypothetical protein